VKTSENGFKVRQDIEYIKVSPANVAPFSLPREVFDFNPDASVVMASFKNGEQERQIHCNIKLSSRELDLLRRMQKSAAKSNRSFMPSVSVMATRFLNRAEGNTDMALQKMQHGQDWRVSYFAKPLNDASVGEDLGTGCMYFTGRDAALRPALLIRLARIPEPWRRDPSNTFIRALIFCMEYFLRYLVLPGKVESLCAIIDFKDVSASSVPLHLLKEVYAVFHSNYPGRVKHFYQCNVPWSVSLALRAVTVVLTERQRQKVVLVNDVGELQRHFALHHLEVDLGGSREMLSSFWPFPLVSGPFTAGFSGGEKKGEAGLHMAVTQAGFRGHLWDPSLSETENEALDLSASAAELLRM